MKQHNKIIRQGDVLLVPVTEIPAAAKPVQVNQSRITLAHGEATGHHHSIAEREGVSLHEVPSQNEIYLLVQEGDALLEHQEHAALTVAPGAYRVIIQREFDPSGERRVQD